jgi:uncharacterized DUF497 family protein
MDFEYEWDLNKASANVAKHGVSFPEAASVFLDPLSLTVEDASHSTGESRFFTIGLSNQGRLLSVFHSDRDGRIRIISARRATRQERKSYESSD